MGATSASRPVLLPEVRRVQRAARSCASSWSSHSAWGLYANGKVRRSHGWTDCGRQTATVRSQSQPTCRPKAPPQGPAPKRVDWSPRPVPREFLEWSRKTPWGGHPFHSPFRRPILSAAPLKWGGEGPRCRPTFSGCCPFPIRSPTPTPSSLPVHPAPAPVWNNGCLRWLGAVERPEPQG